MKQDKLRILTLFAAGILAVSAMASGQATRTWVSGVGDDANPCSRTAPCKTFAGAISKTAAQGEISVLDPGGYGAVTITKSITIDGNGQVSSILAPLTNAVIINAAATDVVTLRNLSMEGLGTGLNGVRILSAAAVNIENCYIEQFTGFGVSVETSANIKVSILDSHIANNGTTAGGGIQVQNSAGQSSLSLLRSTLPRNRVGLLVKDRGRATVSGTTVSGSTAFGFHAQSTAIAAEINLEDSVASNNTSAGIRSEGALAVVRMSDVATIDNGAGMASVGGGQLISFGNNRNAGNGTAGAPTSTVPQQ
jgi:hypothetical protein